MIQPDETRNKIYSKVELLLICGPFMIGGVLGILRYKKEDTRFILGFQNLLIFSIFIFLLTALFLTQKITLYPVEVLYNLQAALSFLYITGNMVIALWIMFKNQSLTAAPVQSLLDKVFQYISQSLINLH